MSDIDKVRYCVGYYHDCVGYYHTPNKKYVRLMSSGKVFDTLAEANAAASERTRGRREVLILKIAAVVERVVQIPPTTYRVLQEDK